MDTIARYIFNQDGTDLCLSIEPDHDTENPRDWGTLGHMYCWHSRYILGDDNPYPTPQDFLNDMSDINENDIVMIRIDLLDHSGLYLYAEGTLPYDDPWDSGQVGWIYATREDASAYGCAWEDVEERLMSEIDIYSKYVAGEVFVGIVQELEDGYDEDNIEAFLEDIRDAIGGIYTKETWGTGFAAEVLEAMNYEGYTDLREIQLIV